MTELIKILETEDLLVTREQLLSAQRRHEEAMLPLESPTLTGAASLLFGRSNIQLEKRHVSEVRESLREIMNWELNDIELPEILDGEPMMGLHSSDDPPQHESKLNPSALRLETFLHGGSFIMAEALLNHLSAKSSFWEESRYYFHLHMHLHIRMFLHYGASPPFPKCVAGVSKVQGEKLSSGLMLQQSMAAGHSPEVLVMEICKALCFRWASPMFSHISPPQLGLCDEFPFFVHAPERVSREWISLLRLLELGVPLNGNSIEEELIFKETTGLPQGHFEKDIQSYVLAELEAFIRKASLPMEPAERRGFHHRFREFRA